MRFSLFYILSGIAGFALMGFELLGARLITPMVGSSLYTWSSVIGVILAGLSLGAYLGGRLADFRPERRVAGGLFVLSAVLVLLPLILRHALGGIILFPIPVPLAIATTSFLLFFIPSTVLGMLQPVVVRLSAESMSTLGRTYGSLSASWSLGSIVGVFFCGFYMIPALGVTLSITMLSGLLLLAGAVFFRQSFFLPTIVLSIMLVCWGQSQRTREPGTHRLFEAETPYFHAMVSDVFFLGLGKSRVLFLDVDTHSVERTVASTSSDYIDTGRLFGQSTPRDGQALFLGAGAYTMPNIFAQHSSSTVTVVENDPAVPSIAERYFPIHPTLRTEISDGRVFLRRSQSKYDFIFGDTFSSYVSVPWHLLTKEFTLLAKEHLTDSGIYALNIISARAGEQAQLFESVFSTMKSVFPYVEIYAFGKEPTLAQNIILVGSPHDLGVFVERGKHLAVLPSTNETFEMHRIPAPTDYRKELTDDLAPTDTQLLPIARAFLPSSIALYQRASQ